MTKLMTKAFYAGAGRPNCILVQQLREIQREREIESVHKNKVLLLCVAASGGTAQNKTASADFDDKRLSLSSSVQCEQACSTAKTRCA